MTLTPDPTFYPSPGMAMKAAPESIAYVSLLNVRKNGKQDAMGVIDVDPDSTAYGELIGRVDFPGDDTTLTRNGVVIPFRLDIVGSGPTLKGNPVRRVQAE